jgi:hypothetical protein
MTTKRIKMFKMKAEIVSEKVIRELTLFGKKTNIGIAVKRLETEEEVLIK